MAAERTLSAASKSAPPTRRAPNVNGGLLEGQPISRTLQFRRLTTDKRSIQIVERSKLLIALDMSEKVGAPAKQPFMFLFRSFLLQS